MGLSTIAHSGQEILVSSLAKGLLRPFAHSMQFYAGAGFSMDDVAQAPGPQMKLDLPGFAN